MLISDFEIRRKCHGASPSASAFTLIELLTAILIIGILAGLAFKVVGKVREAAKHAVSISNIRQVASAVLLYTMDHRDSLPYGQDLGSFSFLNRTQMDPYLNRNDPVWWCPIVTNYYKQQSDYQSNQATWKGRIRTSWQLTGGAASWYTQTGRPNPTYANKGILITSFIRPSESLILFNGDSSDRAGYNDGMAHVGFADGSVKSVRDQSYKTRDTGVAPSVVQTYFTLTSKGIRGYDY